MLFVRHVVIIIIRLKYVLHKTMEPTISLEAKFAR